MTDSELVIAVHEALATARIPHAIGGAIALGHYAEPRRIRDIDVNAFVPTDRMREVKDALVPLGVDPDCDERELVEDGQVRLRWVSNPVHLFFSEDALHEAMPAAVREVPFAGATIPIVSPEHLVIRKAMLNRTKDWLDIEAILIATEPLDLDQIESWLRRLAGDDDPRLTKFRDLARGPTPSAP